MSVDFESNYAPLRSDTHAICVLHHSQQPEQHLLQPKLSVCVFLTFSLTKPPEILCATSVPPEIFCFSVPGGSEKNGRSGHSDLGLGGFLLGIPGTGG